jgi:hypothetical protein
MLHDLSDDMSEDEKKHPSQYLNDLEEWQEHQYNPGYWTGGNIPPIYKYHIRVVHLSNKYCNKLPPVRPFHPVYCTILYNEL